LTEYRAPPTEYRLNAVSTVCSAVLIEDRDILTEYGALEDKDITKEKKHTGVGLGCRESLVQRFF